MILTCPSCSTRFAIKTEALGDTGREVRCGKCGHKWFQAPEAEAAPVAAAVEPTPVAVAVEAEAPQPEPVAEPIAAPVPNEEDRPSIRRVTTVAPAKRGPKVGAQAVGWAALAAAVVLVVGGAALLRDSIVDAWPPERLLYTTVGLPVGAASLGLEIRNVRRSSVEDGGAVTLVLEGEIVNMSGRVTPVPSIRVVLRDDANADLAEWTFQATDVNMIPQEIIAFTTSLANPPADAAGAFLSFDMGG